MTDMKTEMAVWGPHKSPNGPESARMAGNGPEPPETASGGPEPHRIVNLGSDASLSDVDYWIGGFQAAMRGRQDDPVKIGGRAFIAPDDEYLCGGLIGVALIWFAAGVLVAGVLLAIAIT